MPEKTFRVFCVFRGQYTFHLEQFSRIEFFQRRKGEQTVLPDQFIIEPDFAAAVFGTLDINHVPMHGRLVAVAAFFVSLARGEVERTGNLLVEKDIAHRFENVRVETDGKFTHIPRTGVGIENLIKPLRVVARGFDNPPLLENEPDVVERSAEVNARRVILNHAFNAVLHRARKHLAVRDIAQAAARDRANPLD
jgi:hypothetical protein